MGGGGNGLFFSPEMIVLFWKAYSICPKKYFDFEGVLNSEDILVGEVIGASPA